MTNKFNSYNKSLISQVKTGRNEVFDNMNEDLSVKTGIKANVIREIRMIAERHRIGKVVLFGSRARGDFRKKSDIDLAVLGGDINRFRLDVDEETSTLLKYDIIDIGGRTDQKLSDAIKREGITLYEKI